MVAIFGIATAINAITFVAIKPLIFFQSQFRA